MRIGVFSDSHGDRAALKRALNTAGELDAAIFLGDGLRDAAVLGAATELVGTVRGNCDGFGDVPEERVLEVGGRRLLLTHGHNYGVKTQLYGLVERAQLLECDAALFGHTHVPLLSRDYGIMLLNPGSVGQPKWGKKPTFAVLEISEGSMNARILEI